MRWVVWTWGKSKLVVTSSEKYKDDLATNERDKSANFIPIAKIGPKGQN